MLFQSHDEREKLETKEKQSAGLGTMSGVYLPTIQNIFGVILFIRLPWIGIGCSKIRFGFLWRELRSTGKSRSSRNLGRSRHCRVLLLDDYVDGNFNVGNCNKWQNTRRWLVFYDFQNAWPRNGRRRWHSVRVFSMKSTLQALIYGRKTFFRPWTSYFQFYIATTVASAMYILGAVEILINYIAPNLSLGKILTTFHRKLDIFRQSNDRCPSLRHLLFDSDVPVGFCRRQVGQQISLSFPVRHNLCNFVNFCRVLCIEWWAIQLVTLRSHLYVRRYSDGSAFRWSL